MEDINASAFISLLHHRGHLAILEICAPGVRGSCTSETQIISDVNVVNPQRKPWDPNHVFGFGGLISFLDPTKAKSSMTPTEGPEIHAI